MNFLLKKFMNLFLLILSFVSLGYTNLSQTIKHQTQNSNFTLEVIYRSGNNELNSVWNYIRKDLVKDGYIEAPYYLSFRDKDRIYEIVQDVDLASFPDVIGYTNRLDSKSLLIKYDDIEKSIKWYIDGEPENEQEAILKELEEVLDDILFNNDVYRSLPKPRGGRL
ncbi:MAG: hypothetical protein PVH88_22520 [Ignavibacteria bacterium]